MMPRKVLLFGATSAIAKETARLLAADGDHLFLVGRDADRLGVVARDLELRGASQVDSMVADLDEIDAHDAIIERAVESLGGFDTAILAHGVMGDQTESARNFDAAERVFRTNFLGAVSLLTRVANRFESAGHGTIVAISSPAGDRGRQSNYVYGASKGALTVFMQGLRNRLHERGVRVVTVKPGFVDTPMTAQMDQGMLFVQPATVAKGIRRAIARGGDVVYLPWFWRPIMSVIRLVPEPVFKRLKL